MPGHLTDPSPVSGQHSLGEGGRREEGRERKKEREGGEREEKIEGVSLEINKP